MPKHLANTRHEMIVASVAGKNNYTIPLGNFVWDAPGQSTLDVDTGAGFTPVTGYTHLRRSAPGTPVTVNDAAIGFSYGGVVAAGWTFRFRWKEEIIPVSPDAIAKVLVPSDLTVPWNSNGVVNFPNGITVPAYPGTQCEFWRQTTHAGGRRGSNSVLIRMGRRHLPYFRGPLGQFTFSITDFASTNVSKRNRFKVCYYDPQTGARSALSTNTIVICGRQADGVNGRRPVRTERSIWIE